MIQYACHIVGFWGQNPSENLCNGLKTSGKSLAKFDNLSLGVQIHVIKKAYLIAKKYILDQISITNDRNVANTFQICILLLNQLNLQKKLKAI